MTEQVTIVDVDTAMHWVAAGEAYIVDVREQHEYDVEHIPGAHLLPLSRFDPASFPNVPEGQKLLIHCRSGQRCGMATAKLLAHGYKGPINRLAGGLNAWLDGGGPIETGAA